MDQDAVDGRTPLVFALRRTTEQDACASTTHQSFCVLSSAAAAAAFAIASHRIQQKKSKDHLNSTPGETAFGSLIAGCGAVRWWLVGALVLSFVRTRLTNYPSIPSQEKDADAVFFFFFPAQSWPARSLV